MNTAVMPLTTDELDSQVALELPERETPATVVIGCLAVCVGQIRIQNIDVNVAAQVCAAVQALNVTLLGLTGTQLSCVIRQR
jgi:hypothetical protein